jgi:hypothetical protein
MAVAVDGDRLVGAYTTWPVRLRVGSDVVLGAQSMDTMTHPDYQGQGIFVKLARACFEIASSRNFQLLYGFPNPLSFPGFVKHLDFPHVDDVTHWIRPIRPSLHTRIPKGFGFFADAAMRLWPSGRRSGFEIVPGWPGAERCLPLVTAWNAGRESCGIYRTPEWLTWRYADDSESGYRWIGAYRSGRLVALGAWGMRTKTWGEVADNRAHLVELLGEDDEAISAVLRAIVADAAEAPALLLETLCNIGRIEGALRRAGFMRHRQAPLIVKTLSHDTEVNGLAWEIVGGDVDTF